ncbi:hypothetical protein ACIBQX_11525 [Nonomuraea sp. NPDC049714]|uniref:hypothetical protein n=1 Tax=Nonomuraea sp. NPDC049714 TaxID=3364357 RepID=UPI00379740C4
MNSDLRAALRAHRRRQMANARRLEALRDRLALVVAERRATLLDILYGRDEAEEDDRA